VYIVQELLTSEVMIYNIPFSRHSFSSSLHNTNQAKYQCQEQAEPHKGDFVS